MGWLREAPEGSRLVLTTYVLAEVHAFFCRTPKAALAFAEKLRQDATFEVLRPIVADEDEAWALLRTSRDKTYSFIDALSFAVIHRLRIPRAFAFDSHFRQFGRVEVVP